MATAKNPTDEKPIEVAPTRNGMQFSGRRVDVILPSGFSPDEKDAQFVGINGADFLIPRGKRVSIPEEVLEVLNNCNKTEYVANGEAVREVNRFNVQVLGPSVPAL